MIKQNPPIPDFIQTGVQSSMINLSSTIDDSFNTDLFDENNFENIANDNFTQPTEEMQTQEPQAKNIKDYHIQSLFWLLNPKLNQSVSLSENEAMFATLSFNIDHGNLRVDFFNITNEKAISKSSMFLSEMDRLINGVIYPADCFKIANSNTIKFKPFEQIVNHTGEEWQRTRPRLFVNKNENSIDVFIESHDGNTKHFYSFVDYQKNIFQYCCKYVVTTGMQLNGMRKIFI